MWESNSNQHRGGGLSIWQILMNLPDVALLTPKDLGTRLYPITNKQSTMDLTFSSSTLSLKASLKVGQLMGSDHRPIMIVLEEDICPNQSRPQRWYFQDEECVKWNMLIDENLQRLSSWRLISRLNLSNRVVCNQNPQRRDIVFGKLD